MALKRLATDSRRYFDKPRACVEAEHVGNTLKVKEGGGIVFARTGTEFGVLAEGIKVVDEEGNELPPSGTYYVSLETIDPYHLITDFFVYQREQGHPEEKK